MAIPQAKTARVMAIPWAAGLRKTGFKKNSMLLVLTLPMLIYIFIFSYIPMAGAVVAFKQFNYRDGLFGSKWIGLSNFKFFFTSPDAMTITVNTVGYNALFIVINLIFSVFFSILLYEISSRFFLKFYQTTMFIPSLLSWVVVAYMAYAFLNPRSGMLNQLLSAFGNAPLDWYSLPEPWYVIMPLANLWKGLGGGVLLYYASLMGLDKEYIEAASIEGANKPQIARYITLPSLYPLITMMTILNIGHIFSADFGLFYQLPMDSPMLYKTTDVLDTYVYRALAQTGNIGMSSAASLYKSVVGFVLVVVSNLIVKKYNSDNALF